MSPTQVGRPADAATAMLIVRSTRTTNGNAERPGKMFATITSLAPHAARARLTASAKVIPWRRFAAPTSLSEAYDMRLLCEVARWDDQGAFEEISTRHRAAVVRAAWEICRDADAAQDIAQQAFTALWVRAARLVAGNIAVRPWLVTVARNVAIDCVRTNRGVAAISEAAELPSNSPSPEDIAVTSQSSAELASALAMLAPDERLAIELVYFAGMSNAAAAGVLGRSVDEVESSVRLAIGNLRLYLEACAR